MIALLIWTVNAILLILILHTNHNLEKLRNNVRELEKRVANMKVWSEDIRAMMPKNSENLEALQIIESLSRKYEINFESARPTGNYIEVTARGVEPSKIIKFMWELEHSGKVHVEKIRLKKNLSDDNLNDVELLVERK